ncbi:MAG: DUF294 nucleotidyltransferase-like domain-containing protein [Kineosporiaceae bacterium]
MVDLTSAEVRDPLVVRAAIDSAAGLTELAHAVSLLPGTAVELYDAGVPPVRIGGLLAAVLDSVLRRLLVLSPMEVGVECSQMVLGSLARREVLPTSDVDTALVWADPPEPAGDISARVRSEAAAVLDDMEKAGLRRCPDGANADTARFGRSLSAWNAATTGWIRDAGQDSALLLSTMLADSRPVTVDTAALARQTGMAPSGSDDSEPSLERLALSLGLPVHTPHHALGDALTTAGVLLALVTRLEARDPQTVRTLAGMSQLRALG